MPFKLPPHVVAKLDNREEIFLELGCGKRKHHAEALGVDLFNYPGVDIVGDVSEVIQALPDQSVSAIFTYHCLEHLSDLKAVMIELNRILKQNGVLKIVTPHFSNPYFYSDYTHKTFFGLYTFCYFSNNSLFRRSVPSYELELELKLLSVKLIFKSPQPFYIRHGFKKIIEKIVNINSYMLEWYEENLCHMLPCYEIEYVLQKL